VTARRGRHRIRTGPFDAPSVRAGEARDLMSPDQRYEHSTCSPRWSRWRARTGPCCSSTPDSRPLVGLSRRALVRTSLFDRFTDSAALQDTLLAVARNEMATGRLQATLQS
jgi:hypothetical protein